MIKNIFRVQRNYSSFKNKLKRVQSRKPQNETIQTQEIIHNEPSIGVGRKAVQCYNEKYANYEDEGKNFNEIIRYDDKGKAIYRHQPPQKSLDPESSDKYFKKSKPGEPLDFYIYGNENQVAVINLKPNQLVKSESGKILYKTNGVHFETSIIDKTGYAGAFTRFITGQNILQVQYEYKESVGFGRVAFSTSIPSKILPIRLQEHGGEIICAKGSYLCGNVGTEVKVHFQKNLKSSFFGGEGFVLQKIISEDSNDRTVLLKAGGAILKRYLRENESVQMSPGHLVCMESTVDFDIELASSIKNALGGTFVLANLTGPGYIYLQTMAFDDLVSEIESRLPSRGGNSYRYGGSSGSKSDDQSKNENEEQNNLDQENQQETQQEENQEQNIEQDLNKEDNTSSNGGGGWFSSNNDSNETETESKSSFWGFLRAVKKIIVMELVIEINNIIKIYNYKFLQLLLQKIFKFLLFILIILIIFIQFKLIINYLSKPLYYFQYNSDIYIQYIKLKQIIIFQNYQIYILSPQIFYFYSNISYQLSFIKFSIFLFNYYKY